MKTLRLIQTSLIASLLFLTTVSAQRPQDDSFYDRITVEEREAVPLPGVRESDVLWSKRILQEIDLREKINQPLYFPQTPRGQHRSLMQVLEDGIREGLITPYEPTDEHFQRDPMTLERAFDRFREEDMDEDGFTIVTEFASRNVYSYRIKEEWFFDARHSRMDFRIIGILPIYRSYNEETDQYEFEGVFWLPFEQVRPVIANAPVMSESNNSRIRSFDDVFMMRIFNARVIGEERPDGLLISEYPGLEDNPLRQLLEGERIWNEIRNFELDVWHY